MFQSQLSLQNTKSKVMIVQTRLQRSFTGILHMIGSFSHPTISSIFVLSGPLSQYDLNQVLYSKYTEKELAQIHHFETTEFRDFNNQLIVPAGKVVDEDFTVKYVKAGNVRTVAPIVSVTLFEEEMRINERKRDIQLIRRDLLPTVIKDMKTIMRYSPNSNYISKTLKGTEPVRITG